MHGLDLAELDAVAADLDLVVGTAGELDVARRVDPHDVAGGVDAAHAGTVDEPLGGQLGPVVVAAGDALAADVQLAEGADRQPPAVGVEHEDRRVGDRRADRDGAVGLAVELVGQRPDRRLGRPVHVREAAGQQGRGARRRAPTAAPRRRASGGGPYRAPARSAGSATSIAASDGVHCRWVTPWRATSAATRVVGRRRSPARGARRAATPASRAAGVDRGLGLEQQLERGEHVVGVDAEVDEAGDLVDARGGHRPRRSRAASSGVPNSPLVLR